ncbi:MAG: minor capsid protein [Magnetococcales bacterium]|nr:minor capsid protein [Magnetococcales bacterium]
MSDLGYAVKLPPEEAIKYFEQKGYAITWGWRDMKPEHHARAFTVAKGDSLEILETLRQGLTKALAEGRTERDFAREATPLLQKAGWWGRQLRQDPTGVEKLVQLGSPQRLELIYRTNLQTAYMAGRYKQMVEMAPDRPYWQYVAVMDSKTRAGHRALHGRVLRWDDPIWKTIYPPNGFRCRCRVRALSQAALERQGLRVDSSEGHTYPVERVVGTGEMETVTGIKLPGMDAGFVPDHRWDYNPGEAWARWDPNGHLPDCPGEGLDFAEGRPCLKMQPGQKTWKDYNRPDLRQVGDALRLPPPELLRKGESAEEALRIVQTALGVSLAQPMRVVETPVDPVVIRAEWLPHLVAKRDQFRERYGNYLVPTLESPFEVWLTAYEDGLRRRFIGLFRDSRDLLIVARENRDGSLLWNAIRMQDDDLNNQRTGLLLWSKKGTGG